MASPCTGDTPSTPLLRVNEKRRDMPWKAKGEKAMDTNTGGSPGYLSQSNSLEIRLVRK